MLIFTFKLFIIIQVLNIYQSYIIIKFTKFMPINKESKIMTLGEFITQRITNIYVSDIYLGDPPQIIPGFLKTDKYSFCLTNYDCPHAKYYFKEKSKTFSYSNYKKDYNYFKFSDSLSFYSSFYSENYDIQMKNYTIIADNQLSGSQCFHIGTQLLINQEEKDTNLLDGLHKKKLIKTYYYEYKIYDEDEIYLILGLEEKFENNNNYKFIKSMIVPYTYNINMKWGLTFEKMYLNNEVIQYDGKTQVLLDINYGCILGNSDFKEYIKKYFNDNGIFIEPKKYEQKYYIYFFEKNTNEIEIIKNINLVFYHRELNYNFSFNYEDLILEKKNGYYLLIAFEYDFKSYWKFGFPFFKKYKFIFNHDSKLMGFYNHDGFSNNDNNNSNYNYENKYNDSNKIEDKNLKKDNNIINENENNKKFAFNIILIVFLGILFTVFTILFFGILIGKKIFGVRKTKVNELLELYDYSAAKKEKQ